MNLIEATEVILKLGMPDIITQKPIPVYEIKSPIIVQGPVAVSNKPLPILSERQIELDKKLELELEKLRRKYTAYIY